MHVVLIFIMNFSFSLTFIFLFSFTFTFTFAFTSSFGFFYICIFIFIVIFISISNSPSTSTSLSVCLSRTHLGYTRSEHARSRTEKLVGPCPWSQGRPARRTCQFRPRLAFTSSQSLVGACSNSTNGTEAATPPAWVQTRQQELSTYPSSVLDHKRGAT